MYETDQKRVRKARVNSGESSHNDSPRNFSNRTTTQQEQLANDLIATTDPGNFNLDSPCLSEDVVTLRYLRSGAIAPRDFFLAIPTFWLLDEKIPSVQFPAIQDDTARKLLGNTN